MDVQSAITKNVTVIGNGVLAVGVAVQMANKGATVTYIDVTGKQEENCVKEYSVSGVESYSATLHYVYDRYESIKESDIVVFAITGSLYNTVVKRAIEYIKDGQVVIFFPACFAGLNFLNDIREKNLDITVCEAVSFIYVCEMTGKNSINIQCMKSSMKVAVYPHGRAKDTLHVLNQYFEVMSLAQNMLETSLDNMNITLHPLPILLNIAAVEKDVSNFYHYTGGVSPTIGRLMEQIDRERLQIGKEFGLHLTSAYDQLVEYYGDRNLHTMEEYISSEQGPYTGVKGFGLDSRYIEEDIPFLVVPAAEFGKRCGVKTPIMDLCIALGGYIHDKNYRDVGFSLKKMGLSDLSKEEIQRLIL